MNYFYAKGWKELNPISAFLSQSDSELDLAYERAHDDMVHPRCACGELLDPEDIKSHLLF